MTDDEHDREATALSFAERLATMTDADVRTAYLATDGAAGDPWADALAAEAQARNIDI